MAKYYYQFPLDCEQGRLLTKFHRACVDAEIKAEKYAKRMGAVSYYEDPNFFAGGVSCVAFKDPKKVNTDIWRMAYKEDDGTQWFEPNVHTSVGCVKARDGFMPSDVAGRIYKKEPVEWDAVRQMYSLKEWLKFCGFVSSGDKEMDTKTVIGLLQDKRFYTYIDIIPMAAPATGRKRSRDGSKAIQAEQLRMKLPAVHVDDFYRIVRADIRPSQSHPSDIAHPGNADITHSADAITHSHPHLRPVCGCTTATEPATHQPQAEPCTPVFFTYQDCWFIGMDFTINQEGGNMPFSSITEGRFVTMKNMMLRESRNKVQI